VAGIAKVGRFRFVDASRMMAAVKARADRDEGRRDAQGPASSEAVGQSPLPDEPAQAGQASASDAVRAEALDAAKAGDEDAFRILYRTVQPALLRYVRGLVGGDCEDVTSEAWAQIARDIGSFRGDLDGFRGWAATIARNRALDHLRSLRRRPVSAMSVEDVPELVAPDDTSLSVFEAMSTDTAIALIAALPRDQAEAVLLRVVMGLDAAGAGRVLGKRPGAVRVAAHRGLRRLAAQLDAPTRHAGPPASTEGEEGRGE
jgi:RNA polymerase sigma-70 factor, ECF subfamily